ncbi:type II toxin-antitoxin system RelE/ParE family toxin [Brucella pseudintermedia]|uniref:type II toxin-antitoxin system RelE/ParE family toxin n=1 Tax=Brucella pseudintermedia TaxID=370111 RepID=UPI00124EB38F|nr:type II toxin-antitoxin system RelE/ParE family toxin [Brucella pseudintermedia]KAB2680320.1 type II toxin-antitoxin system RelE/ParE family toxin [Brucella pseudintermedia]
MIRSYRDDTTETVAKGIAPKGFPSNLLKPSIRKLTMIESAAVLSDLSSPPGNRLEALNGDRKGQHSIRINDQWRICFVWTDAGAEQVEIVDYH